MKQFWRIVLYFVLAGVGLAVALDFLGSAYRPGAHEDALVGILSLLCPGSWIFAMCIDCELGTNQGPIFLFILIGANTLAYTIAGSIVAALCTQNPADKN